MHPTQSDKSFSYFYEFYAITL